MKIYISATLRNFFGRNAQVEIPASSVRKALAILLDIYPDAKKVLYDDSNKLRSFIQIYVNNKILIDALWDTPLSEETEILLLPAIAGGAPVEEIPFADPVFKQLFVKVLFRPQAMFHCPIGLILQLVPNPPVA